MEPFIVTGHELGGHFHWYRLGDRVFSVLDDDYPDQDDFELQERIPQDNEDYSNWSVVYGGELRFPTMAAAKDWIEAQAVEAPDA